MKYTIVVDANSFTQKDMSQGILGINTIEISDEKGNSLTLLGEFHKESSVEDLILQLEETKKI